MTLTRPYGSQGSLDLTLSTSEPQLALRSADWSLQEPGSRDFIHSFVLACEVVAELTRMHARTHVYIDLTGYNTNTHTYISTITLDYRLYCSSQLH